MPVRRFALIRRRIVEQTVWIYAFTASDAVRAVRNGEGDETDDERTINMTVRRDPSQDQDG